MSLYYPLWIQNTQGFCTVHVVICFSSVFLLPSCPLSFIFCCDILPVLCEIRHLTRNIQIYAHTHGAEPAYYLWNLDQTRPDCLRHFVSPAMSPGTWHRALSARKAFPSPCLVVSSDPLTDRADFLCADRHPLHHAKETDGMKEIGINKILKSLISLVSPQLPPSC